MKKTILFLALSASISLMAQRKDSAPVAIGKLYEIESKSSYVSIKLEKDDAETVKAYLLKTIPELAYTNSGIKLTYETTSPAGKHYTFQQLYKNIPVYGTELKVNVDGDRNIRVIINEAVKLSFVQSAAIEKQVSKLSQKGFCNKHINSKYKYKVAIKNEIAICLLEQQKAIAVQQAQVLNREHQLSLLVLLDENGKIIYQRDQRKFHHAHAGPKPLMRQPVNNIAPVKLLADTLITVKVFHPNPIVSEHQTYSGDFVDNNDADSPGLTAARKTFQVKAKLDATGKYFLENAYVKIVDLSAPNHTPVSQTSSTFDFTRSDDNFEDVNVFYHISNMQTYLHSIGFTNLLNGPIQVDSHGTDEDNSLFNPGTEEIILGDGCVDDGEDADVIIHEFGHAVSHFANNNSFSGGDRGALDEALGDYQACTYHRAIDPYKWEWVFSWDAHSSECWPGRIANANKIYPTNLVNQIHLDGEIWSSAMMEVWTALGKTVTDKLQYTSLYNWTSNMKMTDAAQLVIQADNQLNAGINFTTLCTIFKKYGLYSGSCVNALDEKNLLLSSTVLLPNPAQNNTTLKINLAVNENIQVQVTNLLGELVYTTKVEAGKGENQVNLQTSAWLQGMYQVVLTARDESKTLKLMIVK